MNSKIISIGAGKNGEDIHKPVKNLGWLLRNWKTINHFFIHKKEGEKFQCHLMASVANTNKLYFTEYASYKICLNFLDRPIFRDLDIIIREANGAESLYRIGSPEYRKLLAK